MNKYAQHCSPDQASLFPTHPPSCALRLNRSREKPPLIPLYKKGEEKVTSWRQPGGLRVDPVSKRGVLPLLEGPGFVVSL